MAQNFEKRVLQKGLLHSWIPIFFFKKHHNLYTLVDSITYSFSMIERDQSEGMREGGCPSLPADPTLFNFPLIIVLSWCNPIITFAVSA